MSPRNVPVAAAAIRDAKAILVSVAAGADRVGMSRSFAIVDGG